MYRFFPNLFSAGVSQVLPSLRVRYQRVKGIVTIERGDDGKGDGYQVMKTGVPPDPLYSPQERLYFGDVGQNFEGDDAHQPPPPNHAAQPPPNPTIDVESVRNLQVHGSSSQNSVSQQSVY